MTKVFIHPLPETIRDDNGVGRVIHAQYAHLPALGIELVRGPEDADVIAAHITGDELPRVDVLHCHGLYWSGDLGSGQYVAWHHEANQKILATARRAHTITVPSPWVAGCFQRDMRRTPVVLGHGLDLADWEPLPPAGYVLWNKNRASDVCDPLPAWHLANSGAQLVTTFAPRGKPLPATMQVVGPQLQPVMRDMVRRASFYLATTKETFGIGTLEALAAGVPILGYDWGGTADLVRHKVTGYLVRPGDTAGLIAGMEWLTEHRVTISEQARQSAQRYAWPRVMQGYADLYRRIATEQAIAPRGVSVVIANYNYSAYVAAAIQSCLDQTTPPAEIIVVDDGSTDESISVIEPLLAHPSVHLLRQRNAGVAAARNAGIRAATQPYIVSLDADDELDPRYIETLLPVMQANRDVGIAYSGLTVIRGDDRAHHGDWPPVFDWEVQRQPVNPPATCVPSAAMFRRDMWERAGGYRQVYAPGEDAEFWTRGLSIGYTARRVTQDGLFWYRIHEGSASRTKQYTAIDAWHPWMRDGDYPMAAPSSAPPKRVRSYSAPLVSVIIPVGPGHARYLSAALDSLLGQTMRDWEAIVINDGDTDTRSWGQLAATYPFVRVEATAGQQGTGAARNIGLLHTSAPLVLFLDADDYLMPTALMQMMRAYANNGGRYVYSDWLAINEGRVQVDAAPDYDQAAWLQRGQHAITALIATEHVRLVGGFDPEMTGWEDWDFFIRLAVAGVCGVRVPDALLGYRQHTGQRREQSLAQKDELLEALRTRWHAYAVGEKAMAGCGSCGGGGDAILAARRAIEDGGQAQQVQSDAETILEPGTARMMFVGDRVGAVSFDGQKGRRYRGGNNAHDRYADVHLDDVDHLLATGDWQVIASRPARAEALPPRAENIPPPLTPIVEDDPEEEARWQAAEQAAAKQAAKRRSGAKP